MHAYTLHYFWTDRKSGQIMLQFTFGLPDKEPVNKTRIFEDAYQAQAYLSEDKKQWFKICLEDYLKSCTKENETVAENAAFKLCNEFYTAIDNKDRDITQICNSFLRGIDHFTKILPSEEDPINNHKQQTHLRQLINFCSQETAS